MAVANVARRWFPQHSCHDGTCRVADLQSHSEIVTYSFHIPPCLERPQLWLENGVPVVLFGAAEVTKAKKHSLNVHLPLRCAKQDIP
ncbi:hypothetical protein FF011L_49360 [Roseimaritima multifibrata]|uniref:Uncharacterized protein n=2 Tax=Roseimaritima multifibrata TaxID=1930274 RepID=A0A517MMM1_9BACT|nr:hypothetical protein FF011L_49360 [Roseimaritima multifibrata]